MASEVHFKISSKPPLRDMEGRFATAENAFNDIRRDEMRNEGRRFVGLAQEEAPGGQGRTVAKEIGFRTFTRQKAVGFESWPGQIGAWHIAGTGVYGPRGAVVAPVTPGVRALRFWIDGFLSQI